MSLPAIEVEGISKCFQIGTSRRPKASTFRDLMTNAAGELKDRLLHPLVEGRKHRDTTDFWALRDISFVLQEGDRLGIVGHNGSGKSTLLKILSRITEPTAGVARLRGRVASLLEVSTGFHPELTGRENIYLRGAILGMTRADIKRRFDEIVEFSGTGQFLETPIKHFSSGMYVRLAFSISAHLEPDILIVDEVLAVGDAEFQKKCLTKMDTVSREGRTVIFVSHSLGSVVNLCNRGLLLDHGRAEAYGPIQDVVDKYLRVGLAEDHQPGIFVRSNIVPKRDVVTKVEVLDGAFQPQSNFEYGAPMHVRVHTNAASERDFGMAIRIRNSRNEILTHAASWIFHKSSMRGYRSGDTILASFPGLKLVEDTYFIELCLFEPLSFQKVEYVYDWVHINITTAKPAGSPINVSINHGLGSMVWDDVTFALETTKPA